MAPKRQITLLRSKEKKTSDDIILALKEHFEKRGYEVIIRDVTGSEALLLPFDFSLDASVLEAIMEDIEKIKKIG